MTEDASGFGGRDARPTSFASGFRNVESWCHGLERWQRRLFLFVLGLVSALAVAPLFVWPLLALTLPLLAVMLEVPHERGDMSDRQRLWHGAGTGWWFGFGYFLAGLHWIVEPFLVEAHIFAWLIPFAITLMPGGLALFFALACAATAVSRSAGWRIAFPLAAAIGASEWLRGTIFTGFPWNPLGDGLTGNDLTLQWASLVGINGLTVIAVLIFSLPLLVFRDALSGRILKRRVVVTSFCYAALFTVGLIYSVGRVGLTTGTHPDVQLRLVQPNIPQHEKWKPGNERWVFDRLLDLSKRNMRGRVDDAAAITHIIWPEAALPFLPLRTPQALKEIAELLPTSASLLTGALRVTTENKDGTGRRQTFNSLLVFDSKGASTSRYDKQHLVPFGEYLPFQPILEAIGLRQLTKLRGGFTAGDSPRLISAPGLPPVTPLICYEVIFSGKVIPQGARPQWMLVVTNDAWFGDGAGPRQHFHQSRVRAVEEGLPLVRVSNNGISAVVNPVGRVELRLGLNVSGTIDAKLPRALPPTLFSQAGHWPFWMLLVLCLCITLYDRHRQRVVG